MNHLIKTINVFSTGLAEQHKEHRCGSTMPRLWWVLTSRSWIKLPINVFIFEHQDGLVLFDTGLDPAIVSDPDYISSPIGRWLLKRIFRLHIGLQDSLDQKLISLGYKASDVKKVVFSHLHFDHIGSIAHVPQADLLVSQDEWAQLEKPHPEREWILREHIDLPGAKWHPIEFSPSDDPLLDSFSGSYDVMGDGSMILLPTPGHTPGSLSMLVRTANLPPLLFVGDLTYSADLLMSDQVAGTGNAKQLRASYAKVRALKAQLPELIIVPSHDSRAAHAVKLKGEKGVDAGKQPITELIPML